ncbi:MAG: transglutaminase domain-containing protein [Leptospiraceae bacterium]|nr:transglutaminase domain-containing protein [Leptospiraceae bacterium]
MLQIILIFSFIISPSIFSNGTKVIEGKQIWEISIKPKRGKFIDHKALQNYSNESNSQKILYENQDEILILRSINLSPFVSDFLLSDRDLYLDLPGLEEYLQPLTSKKIKILSDQIIEGKTTQVEFVSAVIKEVRRRLIWKDVSDNSAEKVLTKGFATCAGFGSLTIELLRSQGIPARSVGVFNLPHPSWDSGLHAEIEVYYMDKGWVSYDPQRHNHYAPYPRIWMGNTKVSTGETYSDEIENWRGIEFFSRNQIEVNYKMIEDSTRPIALKQEPFLHDLISREDNQGTIIPSLQGKVHLTDNYIYYNTTGEREYRGIELENGYYLIQQGEEFTDFFYNEPGYLIKYRILSALNNKQIVHNIFFNNDDSIILKNVIGKVRLSKEEYGSYYEYNPDETGTIRLHLTPFREGYFVNGSHYSYQKGIWKKDR